MEINVDETGAEGTRYALRICLTIATVLDDLMADMVVVGGLVPTLLVDQNSEQDDFEPHYGSTDLDLGLSLALLDEERYASISTRLKQAGFEQDINERGNPSHQRWRQSARQSVKVDFLIPPAGGTEAGRLFHLTHDLAAFCVPGLQYAFESREEIRLSGHNTFGAEVNRHIWVCGHAPYVVLKTLAFRNRHNAKDAYDLVYLLQNSLEHLDDIAVWLAAHVEDESVKEAIGWLGVDFEKPDSAGPVMVAKFQNDPENAAIKADAMSVITSLLKRVKHAG
ncbi:hypothetical protein JW859_11945 [bacterium]|nr:hypothetical protein [bacterium]